MSEGGARIRLATRTRFVFALAVVIGTCQVALSARFEYAADFQLTLVVAWFSALYIAFQEGASGVSSPPLAFRAVGVVAAAASLVALGATGYRGSDRVVALMAGAGLALTAAGPRGWLQHRKSLLLLALPLINSPPRAMHRLFDPVLLPITTWCATALNRAVGHSMVAEGNVVHMPNDSLDVVDGCSGLWAIMRLCVLASLVVALFPTNTRQRFALFASAFAVGFCVNVVRVAVLAADVLHEDNAAFAYWHVGLGATLFALGASAAAGVTWWLALRRWGPCM